MNKDERMAKFEEIMGIYLPTEFVEWLMKNGFFTAPASTKYHGNYEGGLFDHCFAVAEQLKLLTKNNRLKWGHPRSAVVVGMFHDLCKIDAYVHIRAGICGVPGGQYEYNKSILIPGHGEKSVMYLAQHMKLTEEETLCIRWHMGAFDDKENWQYYSGSVRKYNNVLWTHQADMIAAQILGV